MNDLRILIGADINAGKSIGDINKSIKKIQKDPSLQKLDLKINIDDKFAQSINKFIAAVSKMKKVSDEQAKVVQETQEVYKKLDGTVTTVTQSISKNGDVVVKTKTIHDANKKAIQDESNVVAKLTENVKKMNTVDLDSIKILRNKADAIVGYNVKSSKGYTVTNTRLGADGSTLVNSSTTTNYKKEREETLQLTKAKEDLRKKLVELAQVGQLSTAKLQELARGTNQSKNITDIQKVIDKYNELKRVSDQLVRNQSNQYQAQKRISEQLLTVQNKAELQAKNLIRRYGDRIDVTSLNNILSRIKQLSPTSTEALKNAAKLRHEMDMIGASAKESAAHTMRFGEMLKTAFSKFPVWMIATTAFYAPIRGLQAMSQTIIQVDSQMTQLKRVMDEDTNFENMLSSSIQLANELGRSITDVNEALIEFSRQGFDENQVTSLAKTATLAQNISELSMTEATSALTAAMTVFNINAEDSINIINKLNEVDNNYATTTKDLAISMTKAGSSAKTFGVSLDELLGHATAIQSATRESGAVVGNSLKSIYSRITTMAEAETVLGDVGISIKGLNGDVRDVSDILTELAGKWSTLSAATQQNIGVTVAGRYQLNRFLALMSNFQTAIDATETSLHSQGSAANENAKYMLSLEARINKMKASWQNLSLVMGDAVMTNTLINLISVATQLGSVFATVVDKVGLFPVVFGVAGVALYGLNSAFKALTLSMVNTVRVMIGLPPVLTASSAGVRGLTISLVSLKVALRGLLAATGVGLLLAGIGFVAEKLMNTFGETADSADDLSDSLTTLADKVSEVERLKELQSEYKSLTSYIELTVEQKSKLSEIESELQSKYGVALSALDSEGTALKNNNNAIQTRIDLLSDEIKLKREESLLAYREQESDVDEDIAKRRKQLEKAKDLYDEVGKRYAEFRKNVEAGALISNEGGRYSKDYPVQFSVDSSSTDNFDIEAIQSLGETIASEFNEARVKWQEANSNLQKSLNVAELGLKSQFNDYVDTMKAQGVKVKDATYLLFDSLASTAALNNIKIADSELEKYFGIFNSANVKSVEDAQKVFSLLPESLALSNIQLKDLNNSLMKMNFGVVSDESGDFNDTSSELAQVLSVLDQRSESISNTFKTNAEDVKFLNSTLAELKENQFLTADATSELIAKYPELSRLAVKTSDGWKIEASALAKLRDEHVALGVTALEQEEKNTITALNNTLARMNYYGLEIESIQTLAEAKKAINDLDAQKVDLSSTPKSQDEAMRFMSDLANNKYIDDATGQIEKFTNLLDEIEAQKKLLQDPTLGVSSSKDKDKKDKDAPEFVSATQSRINAINAEAEARHNLNEEIKDRVDELSSSGKYDAAVSKTTMLLKSQTKEISLLSQANKKFNAERSTLDAGSKYDLSSFVDANGEATESYYKLYNSLGSKKAQEALQDLFDKYQQYTKAIIENKSAIKSAQEDQKDTQENLEKQRLEITNAYLEKITKPLADYDAKIEESANKQKLYNEGTAEYNAEQEHQLTLLKQKGTYLANEIGWVERRLKQGNLTVEQEAALNEWLKVNNTALLDNAVATKELTDARENAYKDWASNVKDAAESALDAIEDFYKRQGEAAKESLDKQLDDYEKFIDDQKKLLNRQNATDDFNKNRLKLQKEASDLQQKINVLQLDNSWEAKSKREELEQDLADKLEEINDLQIDRDRKLREDNYDDLVESKRKEVEEAKSAADAKWQADLNADKYYGQLKEAMLQNNVDNMQSILETFSKNSQMYMDAIGKSIDMNVIDKLNAVQQLQDINTSVSTLGGNPNTSVPNTSTSTVNSEYAQIKQDWQEYLSNKKEAESMGANRGAKYKELKERNDALRDEHGFIDGSYDFLKSLNLFSAETGGKTPAWGSGGKFLLAHEKEAILNKSDTSNLMKVVDWTRSLVSNFKMPDLSKITSSIIGKGDTIYNITAPVTIMGGDKNMGNTFVDSIRTSIRTKGFN